MDSNESIPPAYVVWRANTVCQIGLSYRLARLGIDSLAPEKVYNFRLRLHRSEESIH
jgi:hypothetical protein